MAIFYIDLVNGNDAAAGTSWVTAWKTFTNGPTAARIAPGDEIRCSETSAPTAVGTATWTSGKVGNSITFASAPTKQIDTMKAGWVTMGAGSTVTNAQTTAYVTPIAFGGTTVGALQVATSAVSNLAYKNLGATVDYSGYQQVSFWFRPAATFDCSGAQNMFIRLCSDTAGTAVVNTLTMPKWSYVANTWYPIVIDNAGALGSNIQSVSITTTSATTATFYFDEMFASPANGLTLLSLIGLNDDDWHAIKTIRDADVQLLAGFQASSAAGATSYLGAVDASWMGITQTTNTYKLETFKGLVPATGPANNNYGINILEAGTSALPHVYSGGWNVTTGLQTGITFLDGITQVTTNYGIFSVSTPFTLVHNFGVVRYNTAVFNSTQLLFKDVSVVASYGTAGLGAADTTFLYNLINLGYSEYSFKSLSGCYNITNLPLTPTYSNTPITAKFGNIWGYTTNSTGVNTTSASLITFTFKNIYPAGCNNTGLTSSGQTCNISIDDYIQCATNQTTTHQVGWLSMNSAKTNIRIKNTSVRAYSGMTITGNNNTITVDSFIGQSGSTNAIFSGQVSGTDNVFYIKSFSGPNEWFSLSPISSANIKVFFHNYTNITNYFRVFLNDSSSSPQKYFELQGTDVYTPGSKAIQFTGASYGATSTAIGSMFDLKLASAAVVANKLVTVTARVKRNGITVDSGIYVPGFVGMVPGYTSDIKTSNTTINNWELLTLTFTPTADCVFDVYAWFTPTSASSPNIVWDGLNISQAA